MIQVEESSKRESSAEWRVGARRIHSSQSTWSEGDTGSSWSKDNMQRPLHVS